VSEKESVNYGNFMEQVYGFAQATKVGDTIYVSGQTGFRDDGTIDAGDMRAQMTQAYATITDVLAKLGATPADIVEETLFVTDIMAAATVALEVRGAVYGPDFDVASTLVQIAALGTPDMMIEIKCTARL
jgi:2-iminobutanoate/2-iminopropanoate deaminase